MNIDKLIVLNLRKLWIIFFTLKTL